MTLSAEGRHLLRKERHRLNHKLQLVALWFRIICDLIGVKVPTSVCPMRGGQDIHLNQFCRDELQMKRIIEFESAVYISAHNFFLIFGEFIQNLILSNYGFIKTYFRVFLKNINIFQ